MSRIGTRVLHDYRPYLLWIDELGLSDDQLRAIPVHETPATGGEDSLSLGYVSPGAPSADFGAIQPSGTRQLYAYKHEVPSDVWSRLRSRLEPHSPSGNVRQDDRKFGVPSAVHDESQPPSQRLGDTDPVCGACVNPQEAGAEVVYEGETYYFCAPECRVAFDADPNRYVRK